jgi:2-hydroxychromene-2-carboxylate isomerase
LAFASEVSKILWGNSVDNWHEGPHIADAARRAGLDFAALQSAVNSDPKRLEAVLAANDAALHAAGHWGVPTMVFKGEPFFGQDRFDMLVWRLEQDGLRWMNGD